MRAGITVSLKSQSNTPLNPNHILQYKEQCSKAKQGYWQAPRIHRILGALSCKLALIYCYSWNIPFFKNRKSLYCYFVIANWSTAIRKLKKSARMTGSYFLCSPSKAKIQFCISYYQYILFSTWPHCGYLNLEKGTMDKQDRCFLQTWEGF